jgi:hypothetical protein
MVEVGAFITPIGESDDPTSASRRRPPIRTTLRVPAEYVAFSPDNVRQSSTDAFICYPKPSQNRAWWSFRWD